MDRKVGKCASKIKIFSVKLFPSYFYSYEFSQPLFSLGKCLMFFMCF
jgi:hypothetical protein